MVAVVVVFDYIVTMMHEHGGGKRLGTCLVLELCVSCVMSL